MVRSSTSVPSRPTSPSRPAATKRRRDPEVAAASSPIVRHAGRGSGGLLGPLTQDGEALRENLFEVLRRAPLHEHVPVRPSRLDLLRLRTLTVDEEGLAAADLALPDRGHLGLGSKRYRERVPCRTVVRDVLPSGHLGAAIGFVRHGTETAAAKNALAHCVRLRAVEVMVVVPGISTPGRR